MSSPSVPSLLALLESLRYPKSSRIPLLRELPKLKDSYPSLIFQQISYEKGSSRTDYIVLEGTVPVRHQSTDYNLPIRVLFLHDYPKTCPIVHIVPQPGMVLAYESCRWVSRKGVVSIPFMKEWKKPERNTIALLQRLKAAFEQEMPVYRISRDRSLNESIANIPICDLDKTHEAIGCCLCKYPLVRLCGQCQATHFDTPPAQYPHFVISCGKALEISDERMYVEAIPFYNRLITVHNRLKAAISDLDSYSLALDSAFSTLISALTTRRVALQASISQLKEELEAEVETAIEETVKQAMNKAHRPREGSMEEVIWNEVENEGERSLKLAEMKMRMDIQTAIETISISFTSNIAKVEEIIRRTQTDG